jgi:hypothetical protein
MRPRIALAAFATISSMLLLVGSAQGAEDARDFSGVWQAFTSEPAVSRGAEGSLSAEGKIKVADFNALYPNMIEPGSYCVPPGMPSTMTSIVSYPIEITQTPNRIAMFAELESQYRRLFLDGRDYPENYPTTRMGYSIGHWEGDTLVVETRLLSEMLTGRFPRTESTVVVERISKMTRSQVTAPANGFINNPTIDDNVLAFNLTVTDPSLYSEPQVVTVYYQHIDENSMLEYDCVADLWRQALDEANP